MWKGEINMYVFAKRPLFTACMVFIGCAVVGYLIPSVAKIIIIALALTLLLFSSVLAIFLKHSNNKKYSFLCLILSLLMVALSFTVSHFKFDYQLSKREATYGSEYAVDAFIVEGRSENNFSSQYVISVQDLDGKEDEHYALLVCDFSAALRKYDKISVIATASAPEENNGRYNELLDLYSEDIFVIYTVIDENSLIHHGKLEENPSFFSFEKINDHFSYLLTQRIGGDAGDLSSALLLGNKQLLDPSIRRDFQRAGASHILALSGMHMTIIMGFAMFIMKKLTSKSWIIASSLSFMAVAYLAITGFSVSATRSVIMLLIVYLSMLISGLPDSLTSLSIAGFLILLFSPGAVLDAAFWMSFVATLGILVFIPPINQYFNDKLAKYDNKAKHLIHKIIYSIITAFATGLAAIIPLIVVLCIFIKEISVWSVLSSVILSIPTTMMILCSLLLLILYYVPFVSGIIVTVIRFVSGFMIDFCGIVSEKEGIVYSLNYPFATAMAILLGVAFLYVLISKHRNPFTTLIPFVACLCLCVGAMMIYENENCDNLKVSYINASSTSDILVLSNEREAVVCDISNGSTSSYYLALDEIYQARATEIRSIMLTRYTNQHYAVLFSVCRSYRVRELWLPYPTTEKDYDLLERIYTQANESGTDVYLYDIGESLYAFDNVTIEHNYDYIDRSAVPISLIGIYSGRERLTYVSPAFNESDMNDIAQYHFSRSQYVIFGNKGPKTKKEYGIDNIDKVKCVAFADGVRAAYFTPPEFSFTAYYRVPEEIEFYLDK